MDFPGEIYGLYQIIMQAVAPKSTTVRVLLSIYYVQGTVLSPYM